MIFSNNLDFIEFTKKFKNSTILPFENIQSYKLLEKKKIFISELHTEPNTNPYFFLEFINYIKRNDICFVINYTIDKGDITSLTANYKGEILYDVKNVNRIYFEVNNTLISQDSSLDWFEIWGHACEGWIMNNKSYELFKKNLENDILSERNMIDFIDNLTLKFEFGDIHESIRFISFNDNLKSSMNLYFKNNYNL